MHITQQNSTGWRWMALLAVLINILFNYYLNANPIAGQTMGDISGKYPTLLTPAGYAFSIWGVIYLSISVYAIYQILPSQQKNQVYNHLAGPLIATSLLSIGWLICFSLEYIGLSVLLITGMLFTTIVLFGRSKMATSQHKASTWITIPFGLYVAWLSVATIINTAVWFIDIGWRGGLLGETTWAIFMLGVALAAGICISYKFKDISYPLVIAWATFAIHVARQNQNETIATASLISGIVLATWSAGYGLWLYKNR